MAKKLKPFELLVLSSRSFRTKPQRAFLTIMGMSIGIATVLLLVSLGYGLQYILIGKLMTTQDSLVAMELSYPTESNITIKKPLLDELKSTENIDEVSPVAEFSGEISQAGASGLMTDTRIVEPSYFRLSGLLPNIGTTLDKKDGLIVSSQTLSALGIPPDQSSLGKMFDLKVSFQDQNSAVNFSTYSNAPEQISTAGPIPLIGIISDDSMAATTIIYASSLSVPPPFYQKILLKAKNVDVLETLRDKMIGKGFEVSARIDLVTQAKKITNIITIVLGVFGITALIVSAIGMFNTMLVGFLERIYEVGILKSLGATDGDVRNLFLVDSGIMGFMGGAGGVLIGFSIGKIFNFILSFVATRLGGKSLELFLTPFWFVLVIMAFSILIGFASGYWPAHLAAKLSPKEAFTKK